MTGPYGLRQEAKASLIAAARAVIADWDRNPEYEPTTGPALRDALAAYDAIPGSQFDPRAAGKRAVARHGDALARLSEIEIDDGLGP